MNSAARAAGPEARVVSIESSAAHCDAARAYIARGGLSAQIEVRQGLALDELRRLATEGARIDLAYVDCVKEEYVQYLALLVPCLAERGVIIADNVLWRGHVAAAEVPEKERVRTQALRSFNEALVAHPALRSVILPLGDGVAFAVKR